MDVGQMSFREITDCLQSLCVRSMWNIMTRLDLDP